MLYNKRVKTGLKKVYLFISIFIIVGGICAGCGEKESAQTYDPTVIASLDADYYIDYENGAIPLSDLPIGARVVDPSWEWEFRLGPNYSNEDWEGNPTIPGEVKPVTWIVVAKNHYDGLQPHVTLLAEELIGLYVFDNSTNRGHEYDQYGYNHWGDCGTANATRGLRPWLNSTGIHEGGGFYRTFSESFKRAVLSTTVPNREWEKGNAYTTGDMVFIPSTTELGDSDHYWTYRIGETYPYFIRVDDETRTAMMLGDGWRELVEKAAPGYLEKGGVKSNTWVYWMRSPDSDYGDSVRSVGTDGGFDYYYAGSSDGGVRPVLNLKSEILVSEIRE